MAKLNPKWLIGRTIAAVRYDVQPARESAPFGTYRPRPEITLDNGAVLTMTGEETDWGEYGVHIEYTAPPTRRPRDVPVRLSRAHYDALVSCVVALESEWEAEEERNIPPYVKRAIAMATDMQHRLSLALDPLR